MKKEQSRALSFDVIGGKDVMPIMGFAGPRPFWHSELEQFPDRFTDEYFGCIAEMGINIINHSSVDYATNPELVLRSLELCAKHGMGYWVLDSRVSETGGIDEGRIVDISAIEKYLADYKDYPAYCGVFMIDEPRTTYYLPGLGGRKDIERYKELSHALQYELGQTCYINAFPIWNMDTQGPVYEKYIAEYCETIRPKYLMWDHYPYYPNRECERVPVYFYNMDLIRKYAQKYDIPFYAAIEGGSQWNDEKGYFDSQLPYFPDEAHFDWNVNTCLAFGVQGITYFPLIQPEHFAYAGTKEQPTWDFRRNGFIGADGKVNQWWHYAKRINEHIRAIDDVLMNSVHKGILIHGEQIQKDMTLTTCVIEEGRFEELVSIDGTGEVMVGCFNYDGRTALYLVNYSTNSTETFTISFDSVHDIRMVQWANDSHHKVQKLDLHMAAGEGVLLVIS